MDIRAYFSQIFRGIKSVWKWFPVIWRDRNFDDKFIFILLKKKLELIKEEFISVQIVNMSEEVEELNEAIAILERIIADEYESESEAVLQSSYGDSTTVFNSEIRPLRKQYVAQTAKTREEYVNLILLTLETADNQRKADVMKVCQLIANNHRKWWY